MSRIRDEIIEWKHDREQRAIARAERMKTRVRCVICKARVGQCKPFRQKARRMKRILA